MSIKNIKPDLYPNQNLWKFQNPTWKSAGSGLEDSGCRPLTGKLCNTINLHSYFSIYSYLKSFCILVIIKVEMRGIWAKYCILNRPDSDENFARSKIQRSFKLIKVFYITISNKYFKLQIQTIIFHSY